MCIEQVKKMKPGVVLELAVVGGLVLGGGVVPYNHNIQYIGKECSR